MFNQNTLDVSSEKQMGVELRQLIFDEVKSRAKSSLIVPLHDKLRLRQDQYNSLLGLKKDQPIFGAQEFWIYKTDFNAMEIEIVKPSVVEFKDGS